MSTSSALSSSFVFALTLCVPLAAQSFAPPADVTGGSGGSGGQGPTQPGEPGPYSDPRFAGKPGNALGGVKIDRPAFGGLDLVNPGDQFGRSVASLGDLDGDGVGDIAVGVPFAEDFNFGAVWIVFLEADGSVREATKLVSPADDGREYGKDVASLGDFNGDGTCDLIVGEPEADGTGGDGGFWIVLLDTDGTAKSQTLTHNDNFPVPFGPIEGFGEAVASLGDLDGDGTGDVAIGSPLGVFGNGQDGHVWIVFLNPDGTARDAVKIGTGEGGFLGTIPTSARFGTGVAGIGDLDGDGNVDLAVGVPGDDMPQDHVWILFLNADGTVKAQQEISETAGGFTGSIGPDAHFGTSVAALGDFDGDGTRDLAVGAPGDRNSNSGLPDHVWLLALNADGTVKQHLEIAEGVSGFDGDLHPDDRFGTGIALLGDLDGNGGPDLLIGAAKDASGGDNSGAVWIVNFDAGLQVVSERKIADENSGPVVGSQTGRSVALLEDLDGDGVRELAIGAPWDESAGGSLDVGRGAVWVVFPNADGSVKAFQKLNSVHGGLGGPFGFTMYVGMGVASLGDLNGDGTGDMAVGITNEGYLGNGRVAILFLEPDGTVGSQVDITVGAAGFMGALHPRDRFGASVANLGDLDGDGVCDLAVGAPGNPIDDVASSLWILFLNADGTVKDEHRIAAGEGGFVGPLGDEPSFGVSVAAIGDVNGDGFVDVAVGDSTDTDGGDDTGAVWVLFLYEDGTVLLEQKINELAGGFTGELDDDWFGAGLAPVGDLDGDGTPDVAVGAPFTDGPGSLTQAGAVWVLFLHPDGTVKSHVKIAHETTPFLGLERTDRFGHGLHALGDWNGDGVVDLIVGSPFEGPNSVFIGAAWLVYLEGVATVDFETADDLVTPLANGAVVSNVMGLGGFGRGLEIDGVPMSGLTAAIFDSTPDGPNSASQDPDLLVDRGNLLILQADSQSDGTQYFFPNDDAFGGDFHITFDDREVRPLSIDFADLCPDPLQGALLMLTDAAELTRTYVMPAGWTEDVAMDGPPGVRTLDLTTLMDQPGFAATATASEDPGFAPDRVVRMDIHLSGSGAIDQLVYDPYPGD